ncbi:hypothetical protein [Chryseobacterium sp. HSC-36S06]|uniref:hypothetical protein n=1 Tax=Chryseobacterium sp. HSC-36S06 TaxID=2910970 RepID=UPI0020A22D8C|nr:hypothetical protein [Chryseobacterium sp. HSC-36S06]MCP2037821.1 hypothetical protein [Chryseobacterium sp. HSC-36S06]
MNKLILLIAILASSLALKAQYGTLNAILDRLEEKRGVNKNLKDVNIDDTKFVLIKNFDDHTERSFVIIKGNKATYVEMFDDKKTGETSSNVFSGDVVRSKHNIISLRADKLEGKPIALAVTKTFLMTMQKKVLYLIDVNNKERWIEESAFNK